MTHKHTPGPLLVERGNECYQVYDESGMACLATVHAGVLPDPTGLANATLYAAASAMLEELETGYRKHGSFSESLRSAAKTVQAYLGYKGYSDEKAYEFVDWLRAKADSIEAVVRKATGGTHGA